MNTLSTSARPWWQEWKVELSLGFLVIIYTVGVVGILTSLRELVLPLTPVTLVLSLAVLLWNHSDWNRWFGIAIGIIAFVGFGVEVVGVHTGVLFGAYEYGPTLGPALLDVPLAMAINWLVLIYCTASLVASRSWPLIAKALVAALLMTGLDILIEPMAMALDFWQWENDLVPLQNYLVWFAVSFGLAFLFLASPFQKRNRVAFGLFLLQVLFFGILNLTYANPA